MYPHEKSDNTKKYVIFALLFHLVIVVAFIISKSVTHSDDSPIIAEQPPESSTIESKDVGQQNAKKIEELMDKSLEATTVDAKEVDEAISSFNKKQNDEKLEIEKEKKQAIEQKQAEEREIKRKEQESIQAEKQKKIDQENEKKEALEKKKDIEKQKKLEIEKQLEFEKNKKLEKEKELKEEQLKKENLKKLQDEENERKKKSLEAMKKASEEKQKAMQDKLNKAEAAKKMSSQNKGYDSSSKSISRDEQLAFLKEYRDNMYNKVYSNWIRPSYSKKRWDCKVHVSQSSRGEVIDVKIINCQGNTEFQNSVKRAIFKSSPLPLPKHPSLFDNTIEITFKVT